MSLQPQSEYSVPAETARVAQAVFSKGNIYLPLYDAFDPLFGDEGFAALFPADGQPYCTRSQPPRRPVTVLPEPHY